MLRRNVSQARQIVTKLLDGKLTFTPESQDRRRGFDSRRQVASPTGYVEHCTLEVRGRVTPLPASPAGRQPRSPRQSPTRQS
jgi:hypothetical protein